MRAGDRVGKCDRKTTIFLGSLVVSLLMGGGDVQASTFDPASGSFNVSLPAAQAAKEFDLKLFDFAKGIKTGFRFRTETADSSMPDLGGPPSLVNVDAEALANDMAKPMERDLATTAARNLRSNWLNYANEDFRLDLIQSPSRSGIRFQHIVSGLRFEAERKLLTGFSSVFVGVRLAEDKRYEPSAGCTYTQQRSESRSFCGLRLRVGL